MATRHRVICKPPGLSGQQGSQLATGLAAWVALQRELAERSCHVLRLEGDLQETPEAFFVCHEPAEPVPIPELFNPSVPGWEPERLLSMAAALLDALRVAHEVKQRLPVAHGGICPGVVLIGEDGAEKLTDFGVAAALYGVAGSDFYLQLAVGPPSPGKGQAPSSKLPAAPGTGSVSERDGGAGGFEDVACPPCPWPDATGVWEILPPEITDREDRICSFIDPEKHASGAYQSFEARADIAAAGLLLHLLAEHRHPFFYDYDDNPEYRRTVELIRYVMSQGVATSARREDLRKSSRNAIKTWRELVARMLGPSESRPSTSQALQSLAEAGVRPLDVAGLAGRRFQTLCGSMQGKCVEEVDWPQLRRDMAVAAKNPVLPADARRCAEAMLRLISAVESLSTENWTESEPLLAEALASTDLPAAARPLAEQIAGTLRVNKDLQRQLAEIQTAMAQAASQAPLERARLIEALTARIESPASPDRLLVPMLAQLRTAGAQLAEAASQAKADMRRLEQAAEAWIAQANSHLEAQRWEELEAATVDRQAVPSWREDLCAGIASIDERLADHRRRLEAERLRRLGFEQGLESGCKLLSEGKYDEALAAVEPVVEQNDYSELAARAQELRQRIVEEQEQARRREEAIRKARAGIDAQLAKAESQLQRDDMVSFQQAERLIRAALETPEVAPEQTAHGQQLLTELAERQQKLLEDAVSGKEFLARAEADVAKIEELFAGGQLLEAGVLANTVSQSPFPLIQKEGQRLLADIQAARERRGAELQELLSQARRKLAANDLDAAAGLAGQVQKDRLATPELQSEAGWLLEKIALTRRSEEEARQAAAAHCEQAQRALADGDLADARQHAGCVLDAPHAASKVKAAAQEVLDELALLAPGAALLEQREFPDALSALDLLLAKTKVSARARQAVGRLKEQASKKQLAMVQGGVQGHLERRAELEESVGSIDSFPVDESLGSGAPAWIKHTLTPFETFLHDCTLVSQPPRPEDLLPAGHQLGSKYEIIEFLGRGGMGQVYRARDLNLNREVALKLARPAAETAGLAEALQHEARAIARLKHPHIFRINSYDVIDGWHCFDTDYIRGGDLSEKMRSRQKPGEPVETMSPRRIAEVLFPIAEALAYAHQQDVLHRDIKPQNIYLGAEPGEGPWLIDFGLARIRTICDSRTNTGLCGTPGYIAPEVITSMGENVDQRADIFALGCVLYGLLAGHPPFHGGRRSGMSISRTLLKTLRSDCQPLSAAAPGAPEALQRICARAMAAQPEDRYQNATQLADDLRSFLQQLDEQEARAELAAAHAKFSRRRTAEPAELSDLAEARTLATQAADRSAAVKAEAQSLNEQIEAARTAIINSQQDARAAIAAAREALSSGRLRAALSAAESVLANSYVPELHEPARPIAADAGQRLRAVRARRLKIGGAGLTACAVIAIAFFTFPRGGSREVASKTGPVVTEVASGDQNADRPDAKPPVDTGTKGADDQQKPPLVAGGIDGKQTPNVETADQPPVATSTAPSSADDRLAEKSTTQPQRADLEPKPPELPKAIPPAAPRVVLAPDSDTSGGKFVTNPNRTADKKLTVTGSAEAGTTVIVAAQRTGDAEPRVLGSTTADDSGNYALPVSWDSAWPDGRYQVIATARNEAGVSPESSALSVTILTASPRISVALQEDTGESNSDNLTRNGTLLLTASEGASVALKDEASGVPIEEAGQSGNFRAAYTKAGRHTLTATATDDAGNEAAASLAFALDMQPPELTVSPTDKAIEWGMSTSLQVTTRDDSAVKVTASLNQKTVELTQADGKWTADIPLADTNNALAVNAVDTAGNTAQTTVNVVCKRAEIEALLPATAAEGVLSPMPAAQVWTALCEIARAKWMDPSAGPGDSGELGARTAKLQTALAQRTNPWDLRPTRFIEYFWGPKYVHALLWYAQPEGQLEGSFYCRLGARADLDKLVRDEVQRYLGTNAQGSPASAQLGVRFLSPMLTFKGDGTVPAFAATGNGRFGVVLAPDGPLRIVPLGEMTFEPQQISLYNAFIQEQSADQSFTPVQFISLDTLSGNCQNCYSATWTLVSAGAPGAVKDLEKVWADLWTEWPLPKPVLAQDWFSLNARRILLAGTVTGPRWTRRMDAGISNPRNMSLAGSAAPWLIVVSDPID